MIIGRMISLALKAGLAAIARDPTVLDALFKDEELLDATELAALKAFLAASPPTVIRGYARGDSPFPLYSITLGSEGEKANFIGDQGEMDSEPESDLFGADAQAALWQHSFNVYCMCEHPDGTEYIYELAKQILFVNANNYFANNGIHGISISGMDLAPDGRYVPEHLFVRLLSFKCDREFNIIRPRKGGKAFRVSGMHVDKEGSPSDVGEVKTLITVDGGSE
jgi:hypothetical protein